jgi:hypothetical protein
LKPNGRDGKDGTGRSPKARRRIAPTRQNKKLIEEGRYVRCNIDLENWTCMSPVITTGA